MTTLIHSYPLTGRLLLVYKKNCLINIHILSYMANLLLIKNTLQSKMFIYYYNIAKKNILQGNF